MDEIPEHISNTSAPVRVIRQDLVYGKSSLTPSKYNYNKGYLQQNYIISVRKYASFRGFSCNICNSSAISFSVKDVLHVCPHVFTKSCLNLLQNFDLATRIHLIMSR